MPKHYFTSAQINLMVNGYILDEAHSLNWEVADEKTPVYGFRSETFDAVSFGRTLVYGSLDINFVQKGYLFLTIMQNLNTMTPEEELDNLYQRRSELLDLGMDPRRLISANGLVEFLNASADALDLENFNTRAKAVKEQFWRADNDPSTGKPLERSLKDKNVLNRVSDALTKGKAPDRIPSDALLARAGVLTIPTDLTIFYGDDAENPLRRVVIKEVYFRSQSQMLSSSVQGNQENVIERYQFFAKTVL